MNIHIVGGGRWARTIAGVLCALPNACPKVVLYSRRNSDGVASWIAQRGLQSRVSVTSRAPDLQVERPDCAIVANQVAEHVAAASVFLEAGIPVLVEKPVAIPQASVQILIGLAAKAGSVLAASHVFLFARYFDCFVEKVRDFGQIDRIAVEWVDGHGDIRDSETKSYDPHVTVFDDVLPHIVPLLGRLSSSLPRLHALGIRRGGAEVLIETKMGSADASILLARNGPARRRVIAVETAAGSCRLDFSQEPGVIEMPDGARIVGDPLWEQELKPLGSMLSAFLRTTDNKAVDDRLSPSKALLSAMLADDVRKHYAVQQARWLKEAYKVAPEAERDYALRELGRGSDLRTGIGGRQIQALLEGRPEI